MLLLLACTAPPVSAPLSDAELLALTSPDPFADLAERTEVVADGWSDFSPEGPGLPWEFGGGGEYAVVEATDDVRVVAEERGVRTLVWLPRDRLSDVVYVDTWVGADGGHVATGAPGIRIPAGVPVDVERGIVHVATPAWSADLPIADGLVDQVWRPPVEADEPEGTFVMVERGAVLRDDDGVVLLRFGEEREDVGILPGHILGEEPGRGLFVELDLRTADPCLRLPALRARGWVWREEADAWSGFSWGFRGCARCGGGFAWGTSNETLAVPAGAWLHEAPDAAVVGVTTEDVELELGPEDGAMPGWRQVRAATPWGDAELWIEGE